MFTTSLSVVSLIHSEERNAKQRAKARIFLTLEVLEVPSPFLNGASGVSIVSQTLPGTPGVGPWESTELVPGYSSIISNLSLLLLICCHSQNFLSIKQ